MSDRQHHDEQERARAIGQRVRQARLQAALTQEEAASRAGVSAVAWGNIENGHSVPRPATARKVAEALGVEAGYLLTGRELAHTSWSWTKIHTEASDRSTDQAPPLPIGEQPAFNVDPTNMPTVGLLQEIEVLAAQLRSLLQRAKTARSSKEYLQDKRAVRAAYERFSAVFLELQGRPDGGVEIRGIQRRDPPVDNASREGVDK